MISGLKEPYVLDGVEIHRKQRQSWGLSSPSKGIGSLCYDVRSKGSFRRQLRRDNAMPQLRVTLHCSP